MEERLFEERERAFEAQFVHDREVAFRIQARRDRLFGLWVAQRLGRSGAAGEAYATEFVTLSARRDRDRTILAKATADLVAAAVPVSEAAIQTAFAESLIRARSEVTAEPRAPLA